MRPLAGAEYLGPPRMMRPPLWNDIVDHDGVLLRIEVSFDGYVIRTETYPWQREAVVIDQRGSRTARMEAGVDVQRHRLHATLD